MFGMETWTCTETFLQQIGNAYNRLLRAALNIDWKQKIRNADIYKKHNLQNIVDRLRSRRLKFAGHCFRSRSSAPQPNNDLIIWECDGKRSSKKKTYPDLLLNDVNLICNTSRNRKGATKKRKADEYTLETLGELMGNRNEWRIIAESTI